MAILLCTSKYGTFMAYSGLFLFCGDLQTFWRAGVSWNYCSVTMMIYISAIRVVNPLLPYGYGCLMISLCSRNTVKPAFGAFTVIILKISNEIFASYDFYTALQYNLLGCLWNVQKSICDNLLITLPWYKYFVEFG